jgi:3-hydroxyisobutyrate dehydrogenase-like beta-hydroxyacid dehydrogenase
VVEPIRQIGFIGLGRMGNPMARNLLKAGYALRAYDLVTDKTRALEEAGATAAASPQDAAAGADLIISMILDDAALEAVALGPDGVLQCAKPGAIYADMSTVSAAASAKVAHAAEQKGIGYLRAKVSGSVKPATEGTLTIFVSGPRDAYDRCLDVMGAMGKKTYYVGTGEQAIYLKLVHSMMIGVTAAMIGEAFAFGECSGIDWPQMVDVINDSALGSVLYSYKAPLLKSRDYATPQSTVDIVAKDMDSALASGKVLNTPMPVTALVRELFRSMQARGEGTYDFIGIVKVFEEMAGIGDAPDARRHA